jgi:hypothetical protein
MDNQRGITALAEATGHGLSDVDLIKVVKDNELKN